MATLILNPETADAHFIQLNQSAILIGSAPDANVPLEDESLAGHHVRIEHKPDGYYIISLSSGGGVLVNGVEVSLQRLNHGDKLEIGNTKAVLLLADKETPPHEDPLREAMPLAFSRAGGLTTMQRGPAICPQCGYPLSPGMPACPQCGLPLSNLPAFPMGYIPPMPPGQDGPGILPIIAFLAALTVVAAPVALVLGLMTLSIIRRRGGTVRDRSLAKWSIGLGLLWLMLGSVAAGGIVQQVQKRKQLAAAEVYESKVIRALKNLACAQKFAHTIEAYDIDADGEGEYGSLTNLTEIQSAFFDPDLGDGEAYGYRFSIREATEGQFLAVAEPVRYGETGIRTFVINQSGQIRGGDTEGQHFSQVSSMLPVLQGERSAYYELDDEIAKDVLSYIKTLSIDLADQEKKQRILRRLREDYALTSVGRELDGMETSVDRFVSEHHAQAIYQEAKAALTANNPDVALAKLTEIKERHPAFSSIAAVERELMDLRSLIAQQREQQAQDLLTQAEEMERKGEDLDAVQQLYQRIEKLYPDTDVATRIVSLRPELERQMRERSAETIFSELMELSPESDFDKILNRANQLRRNYNDTDLFAKVDKELTEKERKARASSWRSKTEQNIGAGRMRGALAQLESAARENPDLMYDLRDLFIQLYRSVADTLAEEGDARKALTYYERLSQLLQASGTGEQVSPDLLAQLHNDVGQADFGNKAYEEARWHLSSAAWKYQDDAQFNMRLGAANLYTGLYRPADAALSQALDIRTNMTSALLYRSYLNLRTALTMEKVLADRFAPADETASSAVAETASPQEPGQMIISVENSNSEGEEIVVNASTPGSTSIAAPKDLNLKTSDAGAEWFAQFAGGAKNADSPVPDPKDHSYLLDFDYQNSSGILTGFLQFLEELYQQRAEKALAESTVIANAAAAGANERADARRAGRQEVKTSEQRNITQYHAQLRQLRTVHLEDEAMRKELYAMIEQMKQHVRNAVADLQTAGLQRPQIQSLTEHVLSQTSEKLAFLTEAETLICACMQKEVSTRSRMLDLAEKILAKDEITSSVANSLEREISRYRSSLFDEETVVQMDQAMRSLRGSMNVNVDLNNILRAAEGNPVTASVN